MRYPQICTECFCISRQSTGLNDSIRRMTSGSTTTVRVSVAMILNFRSTSGNRKSFSSATSCANRLPDPGSNCSSRRNASVQSAEEIGSLASKNRRKTQDASSSDGFAFNRSSALNRNEMTRDPFLLPERLTRPEAWRSDVREAISRNPDAKSRSTPASTHDVPTRTQFPSLSDFSLLNTETSAASRSAGVNAVDKWKTSSNFCDSRKRFATTAAF